MVGKLYARSSFTINQRMKLSAIILTYNAEKFLPFLAASLDQQKVQPDEVLVVDNASSDASLDWVRIHRPQWRLIPNTENLGFTGGFNLGIAESQGEYIACLNQDAVLGPEYFSELMATLDARDSVGSVQGEIRRTSHLADFESLTSTRVQYDSLGLLIRKTRVVQNICEGFTNVDVPQLAEIFGVAGTLPVYRKSALEQVAVRTNGKVAYFDSSFFLLKEDVDLAWRLRRAGFQAVVNRNAVAYHLRTFQKKSIVTKAIQGTSDLGQRYSVTNHIRTLMNNERGIDMFRHCIFILPALMMYAILAVRLGIFWYLFRVVKNEWKIRRKQAKTLGNANVPYWTRTTYRIWST